MHQLHLLEHMDCGEESFLLLRQLWRRRTGEEPVNAAYMWKRDSLDVGYRIATLVFLILVFIGGCIATVIAMGEGLTFSHMKLQVIITVTLGALGFGIKIVITLIKHLLRSRSAFGTAIENLADALKVDLEALKFIEEKDLSLLMERFHTEGSNRLRENQSFEARGVKETVYSLGYKRYLKHKPTVEKFT